MSDDRKPADTAGDTMPSEASPHNPGLAPKTEGSSTDSKKPTPGAPYDKKEDPEQQPS